MIEREMNWKYSRRLDGMIGDRAAAASRLTMHGACATRIGSAPADRSGHRFLGILVGEKRDRSS